MKIKEYIQNYTAGNRIYFKDVLSEVKEFFRALSKFDKLEITEEAQDIFHFLQLWLYWKFGINGEIWKITEKSATKFINRKKVWQEIYTFVGLNKNISGYVGNYKKIDKVIVHLSKFGISREKAKEAYQRIVLKELK